jgi:hypothetical protein
MLTWLWRALFGGCEHKWVEKNRYGLYIGAQNTPENMRDVLVELQCEKCGNIKTKRLK